MVSSTSAREKAFEALGALRTAAAELSTLSSYALDRYAQELLRAYRFWGLVAGVIGVGALIGSTYLLVYPRQQPIETFAAIATGVLLTIWTVVVTIRLWQQFRDLRRYQQILDLELERAQTLKIHVTSLHDELEDAVGRAAELTSNQITPQ